MATVIQIKRSTGVSAPTASDLAQGELAYSMDASNSGAGAILYVESQDSGGSAVIQKLGGKYYTDILDGSTPTPANFKVGNGSSTGGSLQLFEDSDNGSNFIALKSPNAVTSNTTFTLPDGDGSNGQFLKTDGSGQLSFGTVVSSLSLAADSGSNDSFSTGETLTFTGGEGIDTTVSDNQITIAGEDASTTNKGLASFNSSQFTVSSGAVSLNNSFLVTESEGIGSNDNDTTLPTSAAVKDYVDTNITAQDLDTAGDSGTGAIDLDSQSLTIAGTANEIETVASGQTITIGLPNNVTVGNNLTVDGNLTVNGTQTTVNSTTVTVDDPIFVVGGDSAPSSDDNKDRGIEFRYHNGSAAKIGFFGFDDSTGKFTFVPDATDNSAIISGTKGNLDIGGLDLAGSITSVDGSAPTNGQILMGHTSNGDMQLGTLTAGEGIDVTNGAGSITLSAEDATATNKGIASFNASEFTVSSGAVSITAIDGGSY
jgi:hypothetical protein|tara:strand:- start:1349 stop:2800 length:1452 start_codon:yes stop_codon:yes gene_type:complete